MGRFSTTTRGFLMGGGLVLLAVVAQAAPPPFIVTTRSLVPNSDGYLYCVVRAHSAVKIDVETHLLDASVADVTEFGSSFVASPSGTGDGRYHVEHDFGSMHDAARACRVSVRGARKRDLHITVVLEARDASGAVQATVEAP